MTQDLVGILLAAGQGTRFGADKRLYPIDAAGVPMAIASVRPLRAVLHDVIAIVEDAHNEIARLLCQEGVRVIANTCAHDGMGTSIACGVAASAAARGWVIALADMPYVSEITVRAVVAALERGADIVAPVYRGRRGHPVGLSARHAQALMRLRGDAGARDILAANPDTLELIEVEERGVVVDIDTKMTLDNALR